MITRMSLIPPDTAVARYIFLPAVPTLQQYIALLNNVTSYAVLTFFIFEVRVHLGTGECVTTYQPVTTDHFNTTH